MGGGGLRKKVRGNGLKGLVLPRQELWVDVTSHTNKLGTKGRERIKGITEFMN